jgi:hypothetical protein
MAALSNGNTANNNKANECPQSVHFALIRSVKEYPHVVSEKLLVLDALRYYLICSLFKLLKGSIAPYRICVIQIGDRGQD